MPTNKTLLLALIALAMLPAAAQTPALPLAGVHYRYWPEQMVQWIGPELPYSMIVLEVDDRGKQPIYDVELIPKSGNQGVYYTNSAAELAIDQRAGLTVHQVAMQLDGPPAPSMGAQYMLRFNTETGTPVVWQFVLGTDVTEQGAGLSPYAGPADVIIYREQGGLAGQGTALRIGNVTSTADVWKELAQPPYFVPYRGAMSIDAHVLAFAPGTTTWKSEGASLTSGEGKTLAVTKNDDAVVMADQALGTTATYTTENETLSRVTFSPAGDKHNHTISLEFSPGLGNAGQSHFEVAAGKKTKVAAGTVEAASAGETVTEIWTFTNPDALRGHPVKAAVRSQP